MKPILVTRASGYIGGRLVPALVARGYQVRCLARDPRKLSGRGWGDQVEIFAGDVLDRGSLTPGLAGCGAAYYLVHSIAGGERSFEERDRQAARNFAGAAAEGGLEQLIYLGGLGKGSKLLSPHLSSRHEVGDHLMTPVPAGIAFPLIKGLKSETVWEDDRIRRLIPRELGGFDLAVRLALDHVQRNEVATRWTNASDGRRSIRPAFDPDDFPIHDQQRLTAKAPPSALFDRICRVGGDVGWYYADPLWEIRGGLDRLIGGAGLRRGRRDPARVCIGDAIDFWRVCDFEPERRLLLHAEMKVPGDAWLEFRVQPRDEGHSELIQTAYFRPTPFWGQLYWYLLYPLHWLIFRGMARRIARAAETPVATSSPQMVTTADT